MIQINVSHLLLVLIFVIASCVESHKIQQFDRQENRTDDCHNINKFSSLREKIQSYQKDVTKIIKFIQSHEPGATYNELAEFCDTFGPRLSGSKSLENAIDYMEKKMRHKSRLNVTAEPVMIPKWEVYNQWAEMIAPRNHNMSILALGSSVATDGTLESDVVLVHDFDDLDRRSNEVKSKIVVFNYKFVDYPTSVVYRTQGALRAAKHGAAAALIRSVTPFSIYSPHAGMGSRSIPTAAITIEDADFLERIFKRNQTIRMRLHIETKHFDDVKSYNLAGDLIGTSRPSEIVLVSGHMDSWYNTDGAVDDGAGMMAAYKAVDVLSSLKLRGKRTIRALLWTSEEFGLIGAKKYFDNHKGELQNFKVVVESDEGTFKPLGLGFKNIGKTGQCILKETLSLLSEIHTTQLVDKFEGSDIELFTDAGVPGLSLYNQNEHYFYYHHTSGDSMTVERPENLDDITALFASTAYVLSNLDVDLRE